MNDEFIPIIYLTFLCFKVLLLKCMIAIEKFYFFFHNFAIVVLFISFY